jgi:hypothetical protein
MSVVHGTPVTGTSDLMRTAIAFRRHTLALLRPARCHAAAPPFRFAPAGDLPVGRRSDFPVESYFGFSEKYFCSHLPQIRSRTFRIPPHRGAYRDRHGRGEGCGGRGSVLRAMGLQGRSMRPVSDYQAS